MSKYIEEEITLAELADRFLQLNNFSEEEMYDLSDLELEVESIDSSTGNRVFVPIKSFIVKPSVNSFYTDGHIKVSGNHRFVENGKEIFACEHPDFKVIDEPMHVVDIEVDSNDHTYLANGRLNHNTTSGGKAIPFHASVRLRLKSIGQIKVKNSAGVEQIIGIKTNAQVVKNRIGPPLRMVGYDIYFESGIDNYGGWMELMKDYGLITNAGAWYTYIDQETGEEIKFQSKSFHTLLQERPEVQAAMYRDICNAYIFKYRPGIDGGIDEVTVDSDVINEEA